MKTPIKVMTSMAMAVIGMRRIEIIDNVEEITLLTSMQMKCVALVNVT